MGAPDLTFEVVALALHRGGADGENPHSHLIFSERGHDGIERSGEQWFRRYNAKEPEKGGGAEIAGGQGGGLAGQDPRGVGSRRRIGRWSGRAVGSRSTGAAWRTGGRKRTGPGTWSGRRS